MKHLWDIHLLLLILLHLLGAATSQVNPGLCCHLRANCITHSSVRGFKCLQTQTAVRSYLRVCESHKMTLSFGQCSLARCSGPDCDWFRCWTSAPLWEPCGPLSLVWPLWSQHACLSPALPSLYGRFMWKGTNFFFLQGTRVATFGGKRLFQIGTKKRSRVIAEIVETRQIFPSKNNLATVYDFSLKRLSSGSVFFIVERIMNDMF